MKFSPDGFSFLKSHWGAIAATDFFCVEVLTCAGLVRYFFLFVIDLKSRRVEIANISAQPSGHLLEQGAPNLTDPAFVRSFGRTCALSDGV